MFNVITWFAVSLLQLLFVFLPFRFFYLNPFNTKQDDSMFYFNIESEKKNRWIRESCIASTDNKFGEFLGNN